MDYLQIRDAATEMQASIKATMHNVVDNPLSPEADRQVMDKCWRELVATALLYRAADILEGNKG